MCKYKRIWLPIALLLLLLLAAALTATSPTVASLPGSMTTVLQGRFQLQGAWVDPYTLAIPVGAVNISITNFLRGYHLSLICFDFNAAQMSQIDPSSLGEYYNTESLAGPFEGVGGVMYLNETESVGGQWRQNQESGMYFNLRHWDIVPNTALGYQGAGYTPGLWAWQYTHIFVIRFQRPMCGQITRLRFFVDAKKWGAPHSEWEFGELEIPCEEEPTPTFTPTTPTPTDTPVPPTVTPTPLTPTVTPTVPTPTFTPTPLTPTVTPTKTWTPTPTPTWTKTPTKTITPTKTWTPTWTPTLTSEPTPTWTPPIEGEPPVLVEKKHWHDYYLCPGWGQRYDIVVTNQGYDPLDLVVVDYLPSGVRFSDTTDPWGRNSGGSYSAARHAVEWTIARLRPGQQVKLHLHVYIKTNVPIGAEVRNPVRVLSATDRSLLASATNSFIVGCPTGR